MIEESLVKSHFVGRDGFRWWIGQVAPTAAHMQQLKGGGWGYRYKVRIMGYHPQDDKILKNEDLPWAQVMLPVDAGSGADNMGRSVRITPGDTVMGFFLDGDNAQIPIIQGVLGRTMSYSAKEYSIPFKPFVEKKTSNGQPKHDGSCVLNLPINEMVANLSGKRPSFLTGKLVEQLNEAASVLGSDEAQAAMTEASNAFESVLSKGLGDLENFTENIPPIPDEIKNIIANPERTISEAIGDRIPLAGSSDMLKIESQVNNLVNRVQGITKNPAAHLGTMLGGSAVERQINEEIENATTAIKSASGGITNNMIGNTYKKVAKIANKGLVTLGNNVYSKMFAATKSSRVATMAKKAAQNTFFSPIQAMETAISCLGKNIMSTMGAAIKGLLKGLIENVSNFVSCIADQFLGGLMNQIIGGITKGLSGLLGPLGKILGGFNLAGMLRGFGEGMLGQLLNATQCGGEEMNPLDKVFEWVIGKGPANLVGVSAQNILSAANIGNGIVSDLIDTGTELSIATGSLGPMDFLNPDVKVPGFKSPFGECFAGTPFACGAPKVKFFGGGGTGATAKAILGSIVETAGGNKTSSILGIDITSGGSGYTVPPFVEIQDSCDQGYGGVARAVIDYDEDSPTYQQVVDVYVVSEGENYPVGEDANIADDIPYVIGEVFVKETGKGYKKDDKVTDGLGNEYTIEVTDEGAIRNILPINTDMVNVPEVKNLQDTLFFIESETGRGAQFKPRLKVRPTYQGEVKEVIDCVT